MSEVPAPPPTPWRHLGVLAALLLFLLLAGGYYCFLHRKPFTQNAFLIANTSPATPLVPGYLEHIAVRNHQRVKRGELLFTIYTPPYELKWQAARAAVVQARAEAESARASVRAARAAVAGSEAVYRNALYLARQTATMYSEAAVSQRAAEIDRQNALSAAADLETARHTLAAQEALVSAKEAALIRLTKNAEAAKIERQQTEVRALHDGVVSNMHLAVGGYYPAGEILFALIDDSVWWVQANFEETDLSLIRPGQKALVWLWQYPGKEFHGVVESIEWSAERRTTSAETGVQTVANENQWFMLPQRFPVQIRLLDPDPEMPFHLGASAFVQIETSSRLFQQLLWRLFRWK